MSRSIARRVSLPPARRRRAAGKMPALHFDLSSGRRAGRRISMHRGEVARRRQDAQDAGAPLRCVERTPCRVPHFDASRGKMRKMPALVRWVSCR
jgi:hypothetical protein